MKRIVSILMVLLLLSAPRALAEAATGSVSVRMRWNGEPVPGGSITLYRVASLGEDWRYAPVPAFSDCGVDMNGALSPADGEALSLYAAENNITGQTRKLDDEGAVCFAHLETGLYLLVQEEAGTGYLPVRPFFVGVPQQMGGRLLYQVDASPKCAPEPADPGAPQIPQTGQLRWPVPMLAGLGLLLLSVGLLLHRRDTDG